MEDALVIQWTIIGVGGGLALLVIGVGLAVVRIIKAEMRAEISGLRAETNTNVARLETSISGLRQQIVAIRQMLARFALHRHGDDGLPVAPLTDSLDPPEGTAGGSNGEGDGN